MKSVILALALFLSGASAFGPSRALPSVSRARAGARSGVKMELILPEKDYLIAPSILSANFATLGEEVKNAMEAGADVVHFDVMDNHYVPNLTIGPLVCKALRDYGIENDIDVHLMVSPVDRIVGDFADAGASYITFTLRPPRTSTAPCSSSGAPAARRALCSTLPPRSTCASM